MPPAPFSHIDLRCPLFISGQPTGHAREGGTLLAVGLISRTWRTRCRWRNKAEARAITAEALPYLVRVGEAGCAAG